MTQRRITGWLALAPDGGELALFPPTLRGQRSAARIARRHDGYVVPTGADLMPRIIPTHDYRKAP